MMKKRNILLYSSSKPVEVDTAAFEGSLEHGSFSLGSALACKPDLVGTFCIFRHAKVASKGHCVRVNEKAHSGFHFAMVAGFLFG